MLVTPPFGASSNIALWRAYSKPPVELVVADLVKYAKSAWKSNQNCECKEGEPLFLLKYSDFLEYNKGAGI